MEPQSTLIFRAVRLIMNHIGAGAKHFKYRLGNAVTAPLAQSRPTLVAAEGMYEVVEVDS